MNLRTQQLLFRAAMAILLTMCLAADRAAWAQAERPAPARPESRAAADNGAAPAAQNGEAIVPASENNGASRVGPHRLRQPLTGKVTLAFNEVPVDEKIVGFIADLTGKVVIPINLTQLKIKKITLMHEEPVEGGQALDLLLTALRLNGVGISETDEVIVLDDIQNLRTKPVPVYTARDDIMDLTVRGNFIVKIYRLSQVGAEGVYDKLQSNLPDYASMEVDANSNQIMLGADVGTAQHYQRLINELDHVHIPVKTETFRLAYADATAVSNQIYDLFENTGQTGQQGQAPRVVRNQRPGGRNVPGAVQQTPAGVTTPGPVVELRVSVNVQQNSITVSAEQDKVESIGKLIQTEWDLPRAKETFRVYVLEHTDPIKMRDLISNLMGGGSGSSSRTNQAGRAGAVQRPGQPQGAGGGGGAGISDVIGDIYRVEAYTDRNSIIVLSKTKEALDYLDAFIAANDLPSSVGLPMVVELKHANAVSLADELNVLLAEAGTGGSLSRPDSGLTAEGPGGFSSSGTGQQGGQTAGTTNRSATGGSGTIEFPWQRGRQRDDQAEPSSLIGKVRIVPIIRQNALAVLAPIAQRHSVVELIRQFDKPGRQVMISAIIAEVQLSDDFALGLRLSSSAISPTQSDNAIGGTVSVTGTTNNLWAKLFDTSVLDVNTDINVLIQALRQKTNVRIIQEPRVFTADNQEAAFFDGQQIPFITNSVVNAQVNGGVTQSFEYKDVGVLLNVRPRITVQRDVDMEIKLALSAVVPGQTLFGGAILDLRQTTTKVIVKNAQTIVLSGLLKDLDSKVTRGLPLLSDLPLIGDLFKSHENAKTTSELIAFITPIVVDNPSENDDNFNKGELESLHNLSKPLKSQSKELQQERQRIREKILSPKNELGEPIPLGGSKETTRPAPNQLAAPRRDERDIDEEAPEPDAEPQKPPVDVDDLSTEPSS